MTYTFQTGKGVLEINDQEIIYGEEIIPYTDLKSAVYSYGINMMRLSYKDGGKEDIWLIQAELKVAREAEKFLRSHITSDLPAQGRTYKTSDDPAAVYTFTTPHGKLLVKETCMECGSHIYSYKEMKKVFYIVGSSVLRVIYKERRRRDMFWLQDADLRTAKECERYIQTKIKEV